MRQPKKPIRFVEVDLGYMTNECWYRARVICSQRVKDLFGDGDNENLLVELPGGERKWVAFWRE